MEEQIITFETAKLAKEKGFSEICDDSYVSIGILEKGLKLSNKWKRDYIFYSAPTQSFLQKWLRETHDIHVWCQHRATYYHFWINNRSKNIGDYVDSYEQALEKGLYEALKLIK